MGDCVWYWLSTWRARHQKSECDSHLTKVTAWVQTTSPCDWWALRLVESELAVESEFVMMDWGTHESLKKSGIGSKKWRTMKLTAKSFISHSQHSWSSTETQSWLCWPKTSYPFKVANITSAASGGHGKRLNIFFCSGLPKEPLVFHQIWLYARDLTPYTTGQSTSRFVVSFISSDKFTVAVWRLRRFSCAWNFYQPPFRCHPNWVIILDGR